MPYHLKVLHVLSLVFASHFVPRVVLDGLFGFPCKNLASRLRVYSGVLCFFATAIPAALYQFTHDPSLKWVAAACFAGAGVLMTFGWALNSRGSLRSLAGLMSLVLTALLVLSLRLILPPSYVMLTCVLGAISWILILAALNYERIFRRADSGTE